MITSNGSIFYGITVPNDLRFKAAGWRYVPSKKAWTTFDITRVVHLRDLCDAETLTTVDKWVNRNKADIAASVSSASDLVVPAPEGLTYRSYQLAGIDFMSKRKNFLNADVPRLGKTIQTAGLINLYNRPLDVLIVCPALAKINWTRELRKWLVHPVTVDYFEGSKNPESQVCVINYDILQNHLPYLKTRTFDIVIFDEAHMMKNKKAKRTKAANKLKGTIHTGFLTGTPIFTRPVDLWNIIERCDPRGLGSNWLGYVKRYCAAFMDGFAWDVSGSSNEEELQLKLRKSFMIRREKSDVLTEIPPSRQTVFLPKKGLEKLIKQEINAVQDNLSQLLALLKLDLKEVDKEDIQALDKITDDIEAGPIATIRRDLALAKVNMVIEHCQELLETEKKLVVFTHHRDVTTALSSALGGACVVGGMTAVKRQAEVDRFREDPDCRVIVGNIQAMGTALSLAAADVAVFAELSWVPAEIDQAEERIWDPTKTTPCTIIRLVVQDSLEAQIAGILEKRQQGIDRMTSSKYLSR